MDLDQTMELIKKRRSVRRFSDTKIDRDKLKTLTEAAIWAPTGSNAQAWQFVVVDDDDMLRRLTAFLPGVLQPPPAMVCLCIDYAREQRLAGKLGAEVLGKMDVAMAAQNVMLVATAMGLGSCVIRGFNEDIVRKALYLPQPVKPELIVLIGQPLQRTEPPLRRPLKEVLHWQKYEKYEGGTTNYE